MGLFLFNSTLAIHCRTPVVVALCGLFELASDVDTETRHANKVCHYFSRNHTWHDTRV